MNANDPRNLGVAPATIYCTQCGGAMRVAPQHIHVTVGCPHCGMAIEPWRAIRGPDGEEGYSWRNRWVAGLLGVLLGPIGVHRFYLGYVGIGILQIIVTIITAGFGGFWGFIEGILWLAGRPMHDADGLPLNERQPWLRYGRVNTG